MERFLSFSLENVTFIDSYSFLLSSLDQLAKDVLTDEGDWNHVYEAVKNRDLQRSPQVRQVKATFSVFLFPQLGQAGGKRHSSNQGVLRRVTQPTLSVG